MFPVGQNSNSIKSISFSKHGPFKLDLFYEPEIKGFKNILASYELIPTEIKEKEFK